MARTLIILGVVLVVTGVLWPVLGRLGLGQLPGDIVVRRDGFVFYFPLTTMILVSGVLSLLFWLFGR
jgi:hypothetical protein